MFAGGSAIKSKKANAKYDKTHDDKIQNPHGNGIFCKMSLSNGAAEGFACAGPTRRRLCEIMRNHDEKNLKLYKKGISGEMPKLNGAPDRNRTCIPSPAAPLSEGSQIFNSTIHITPY
jgi:hypothetical protein